MTAIHGNAASPRTRALGGEGGGRRGEERLREETISSQTMKKRPSRGRRAGRRLGGKSAQEPLQRVSTRRSIAAATVASGSVALMQLSMHRGGVFCVEAAPASLARAIIKHQNP